MSAEHVLPRGLLPFKVVSVHGLPWCRDTPTEVGIAALTAKILCQRHNNALSVLDSAAIAVVNGLRECERLTGLAERGVRIKPAKRAIVVNGTLFERWLLKTAIGMLFERPLLIGDSATTLGRPTDELVGIAFGDAPFPGKMGMYMAVGIGAKIHTAEGLKFSTLKYDDTGRVHACLFEFRGIRILLLLDRAGVPVPLWHIHSLDRDWRRGLTERPFRRIDFSTMSKITHSLHFDWPISRPLAR